MLAHRSCSVGGHTGSGPPSGAGTCGTAAATYVPTSPHIRIATLIACFMVFSSASVCKRTTQLTRRRIIKHESSQFSKFNPPREFSSHHSFLGTFPHSSSISNNRSEEHTSELQSPWH